MRPTVERIEAILREQFDPVHLELTDDSERHVGHPGASSGGGHYQVLIVSPRFEGQPLLARHRLIHRALRPMIGAEIHALGLRTLAPSEWRNGERNGDRIKNGDRIRN